MNYPSALLLLPLLCVACVAVDPTYEDDARAADIAARQGDWLRSGTLWHGIYRSDRGLSPRSSLGLARALFEQGDPRGALATMRLVLELDGDGEQDAAWDGSALPPIYLLSADCHARLGSPAEERRTLEVGLALAPAHAGLLRRLGELRLARGEVSGGAELLGRLHDLGQGTSKDQRRLARARAAMGNSSGALQVYRAAIEGGATDLWAEAGALAFADGQLEQAREWLASAAEHDPQDGHVQYLLGVIALGVGERSQASEHLYRGLEIDPTDTDCLLELARLRAGDGEVEAAVRLLESSLKWEEDALRRGRIQGLLAELEEPGQADF